MIYKPEHVVDLETGAILDADVRPGDAPDTEDLTDRVLETEARVNQALGDPKDTGRVECVAADTGYFKLAEIELLQGVGIQTVIPDSQKHRRLDRLTDEERAGAGFRSANGDLRGRQAFGSAKVRARGTRIRARPRLRRSPTNHASGSGEHSQALPDPSHGSQSVAPHAAPDRGGYAEAGAGRSRTRPDRHI
jgi:hypothetical protein